MGTLTEVFSNFLLFFLVFGMSATVDIDKLRKQLTNRHGLLTGVSLQFLILPFVGFCVVKIFQFSAPVGITLLVVTSSPGGSYSNWWCSLFNAELALSVTMTALSTMLSVIMLPVNLIIYASGSYSSAVVKSLDWYALFMSLFVVIGGISSGLFCSAYFKDNPTQSHQIHKMANRFGNVAGLCLISYSILVSSSDHKAALWDQDWTFFVGIATPALIGISIATVLATRFKLEKPERVAVAVESCYQNTGIATSVAAVMFDTDKDSLAEAISVPLYYGMVEAIMLATFCLVCWKIGWTKAPADEKLCVILATSYEVEQEEAVANATSMEVVLGDVSRSPEEGAAGDIEKAEGAGDNKPPALVFEQSETDDESANGGSGEVSGVVILRKVDTEEATAEAEDTTKDARSPGEKLTARKEGSSLRNSDHDGSSRQLSFRSDGTSDSLSDEGAGEDQQMDGSGKEQLGRFGKTISFVKARGRGYRRAPVPLTTSGDDGDVVDDEEIILSHTPREPPSAIPASGEIQVAPEQPRYEDHPTPTSSPSVSPIKKVTIVECPPPVPPPITSSSTRSEEDPDATPAKGKTID